MCERIKLVELFTELASIDALSGSEKPVIDYLINFAIKRDIPYKIQPIATICPGDTGNLIFTVNGGGDKLLVAHMDTVRSTKKLKVVYDGEVIRSDGRSVLGADNRAGIVAILSAIDNLLTDPNKNSGFYAAFTVCEETSLAGSINLELPGELKHAFVFDSYLRPGKIIVSSFGALGFDITLSGKGDDDNSGIINAAKKIIGSLPQGRIESETTFNIDFREVDKNITDSCEAILEGDIRSSATGRIEENLDNLIALTKMVCQSCNCEYSVHINWDFKPYHLSNGEEILDISKTAIEKSGLEYEELVSIGGSDANSFNERGLPAVNFGIGAQNPHSNDEFIYIEDLESVIEIIKNLVKM